MVVNPSSVKPGSNEFTMIIRRYIKIGYATPIATAEIMALNVVPLHTAINTVNA